MGRIGVALPLVLVSVLAHVVGLGGCTAAPAPRATVAEGATAAPRGHAHNDYLHARPLRDALAAGFRSVEVDVFLVDGDLLVGHDTWMLQPTRTFERLYLLPLVDWLRAHDAAPGEPPFLLLVDIKRDGAAVLRRLETALVPHRDLLCTFTDEAVHAGRLMVVLSGDRPRALVARERERLVAIDGRIGDLRTDPPRALVPLVSDAWTSHFDWDAVDPMPDDQRERLRGFVAAAHAQGRLIRFWAAPDRPEAWTELAAAGVDLINTDRPRDFAAWAAGSAR